MGKIRCQGWEYRPLELVLLTSFSSLETHSAQWSFSSFLFSVSVAVGKMGK